MQKKRIYEFSSHKVFNENRIFVLDSAFLVVLARTLPLTRFAEPCLVLDGFDLNCCSQTTLSSNEFFSDENNLGQYHDSNLGTLHDLHVFAKLTSVLGQYMAGRPLGVPVWAGLSSNTHLAWWQMLRKKWDTLLWKIQTHITQHANEPTLIGNPKRANELELGSRL